MTEKLLYRLLKIRHHYNSKTVLSIDELNIQQHSSTGFSGPNGCGKSTLLQLLAFLMEPSSGSIFFKERKSVSRSIEQRRKTVMLLQSPHLLKRSIFENVAYGLRVRGIKQMLRENVFEALELVGLDPAEFSGRRWNELSGGEAQRVCLASRLALKPEVLLLDEPTAGVDAASSSLIKESILQFRKAYNTSLIIASHDTAWLREVADETYTMRSGMVVGSDIENIISGPWEEDSDRLRAKHLEDGQLIKATAPPDKNSMAILHPSDIIISLRKPAGTSAVNTLKGKITGLRSSGQDAAIITDVLCGGLHFTCEITEYSLVKLKLYPGKKVWLEFKASALKWH